MSKTTSQISAALARDRDGAALTGLPPPSSFGRLGLWTPGVGQKTFGPQLQVIGREPQSFRCAQARFGGIDVGLQGEQLSNRLRDQTATLALAIG